MWRVCTPGVDGRPRTLCAFPFTSSCCCGCVYCVGCMGTPVGAAWTRPHHTTPRIPSCLAHLQQARADEASLMTPQPKRRGAGASKCLPPHPTAHLRITEWCTPHASLNGASAVHGVACVVQWCVQRFLWRVVVCVYPHACTCLRYLTHLLHLATHNAGECQG